MPNLVLRYDLIQDCNIDEHELNHIQDVRKIIESKVSDGPDTSIMLTNRGDRWVTLGIVALGQATPIDTFLHVDDLLKLRLGISNHDPVSRRCSVNRP